jgi:hypothetical protein
MKVFRLALIGAAIAATATTASAQRVEETRSGIPRVNLISANPIGILFEWYNGEYERALSSTVSLAGAASSYDFDDARYASVDGIVRYYPSGRALRGFSIGASAGFISIDEDFDCEGCDDDESSATIGVRADYVWILGRDQRFAAAAGIGAKRLLSDDVGTEGVPIGRLSIGYAW